MTPSDDARQPEFTSLKDKLAADLPNLKRQMSQGMAGRPGPDERLGRGARPLLSWGREADYDSAFRLLQMASEAIDVLHDRCRRLEIDAREVGERAKIEADSSERVIKDWERLATALKAHLATSDAAHAETQAKFEAAESRRAALEDLLKSTEDRALALEARAVAAESRADAAEQRAAREIEVAATFRDTIIQTFGLGSRLSSVLAGDQAP